VEFIDEGKEVILGKKGTQCAFLESNDPANKFAVLVFRGSSEIRDWKTNFSAVAKDLGDGIEVHSGFYNALECVWAKIKVHLERTENSNYQVFFTGHSLGGALANLAALRWAPKAVYTIGAAFAGNRGFANELNARTDKKIYRIVNNCDIVPYVHELVPMSEQLIDGCHAGEFYYITHDNKMMVNPDDSFVKDDRKKSKKLKGGFNSFNDIRIFERPEQVTDHAPINYVTFLADQLG